MPKGIRGGVMSASVALALVLPGPAGAAVQLGQLKPPADNPSPCSAGHSNVQTFTEPDVSYTVPAPGGVITSWQHRATATGGSGRVQFWRGNAMGPAFTLVGRSEIEAFSPGAASSFQTGIPVSAGDLLGLRVSTSSACVFDAPGSGAGDILRSEGMFGTPDPLPGATVNLPSAASDARLNVAATLEPDADNDGFGDETQDACPTDGTAQGPCPVPETTITVRPKDKTKKKRTTFEFTSSIAGATFECRLDSEPFAPCSSPDTFKAKKGRHHFEVRASAKGQTDGSPASDDWKVKKKNKKH